MLAELIIKDVSLSVENGNLIVETTSNITESERNYLRKNKQILIEKLNKQRCTNCIHLFVCSCARNTSGICNDNYNFRLNKDSVC